MADPSVAWRAVPVCHHHDGGRLHFDRFSRVLDSPVGRLTLVRSLSYKHSPLLRGLQVSLSTNARSRVWVRCDSNGATVASTSLVEQENPMHSSGRQLDKRNAQGLTSVMKFGGSSLATVARIKEVARLVQNFLPHERPVLVLSAMGKTTNNLLKAGEKALHCGVPKSCYIEEFETVQELHKEAIKELGIDESVISEIFDELRNVLMSIALMKELTPRTQDRLVSFGERLSTRIFAAYMNKIGVKARQYDAPDAGFITTDEFTNAEILEATYPAVAKRFHEDWQRDPAMPVVTGFLGRGQKSDAITTLGRGGSDLTATVIGKALGLREIQVWKDVDGVLTCDPNVHALAVPVPCLTFDEATELAYFGAQVLHPQSMRPAREANIPVRVKNSYNPHVPGTLITREREMNENEELTSIVLKRNITMLDIVSTRMLGQVGFLARVFSIFENLGISVDVVATSEVSISLTLDPIKIWSRDLIQTELDNLLEKLQEVAVVKLMQKRSIISLIGNVERSSFLLEKVFNVFKDQGVNVQMISQGASKVNISLIVNDSEAERCVKKLHSVFFEEKRVANSRS